MKQILLPLIFALLFLIFWDQIARTPETQFLFSTPANIGSATLLSTKNLELPNHALVTGTEALTGFLIGTFFGTISGFLLWYFPLLRISTQPFLFVLGVVPIIAFAPLVLIWFGFGFIMKVALAALATFLISLSQALAGASQLKESDLKLLKILGATRAQILLKAVIPMSMSWVFQSLKMNIGFALLGAFVGEFISGQEGVGYFMIRAGSLYDIASVFAGGIYIILLALIFRILIVCIEKLGNTIVRCISISPEVRKALEWSAKN